MKNERANKKVLKISIIFLLIIMQLFTFSPLVEASGIIDSARNFLKVGDELDTDKGTYGTIIIEKVVPEEYSEPLYNEDKTTGEKKIVLDVDGKPKYVSKTRYVTKYFYANRDKDGNVVIVGDKNNNGMKDVGEEWREASDLNENKLKDVNSIIFNILFAAGVILAVIIGGILGIKFMFGSLAEKAEIKEKLIPYVFGCVLIFGAFAIWKLVASILQNF